MERFGDVRWAERTKGVLSGWERVLQIANAAWFQLGARLRARPRDAGFASAAEVDRIMREVALPSSDVVRRAAAFVESLGPAPLAGHALRTHAWGLVLGLRDGLSFDRERFALAALLHDVALAARRDTFECFAADGAERASGLLASWGVDEETRGVVADAICMHLRVEVPRAFGAEAHLVHAGAAVDVIGSRLREIPEGVRAAITARHPRDGAKRCLLEALTHEAEAHPRSRIALWVSMGFRERIAKAPFDQ